MILTPISVSELPGMLQAFERGLRDSPLALAAFRHIANTLRFAPNLQADLNAGRQKAVSFAHSRNIATLDEDPACAFSWDGQRIRTRSETSVVFHEVAHWHVAPPARRRLFDFGLGAGPETGRIDEANAVACADAATKENEENLSSLLGILWEADHHEPAILAFAEQNWLELPDRPFTARHFATCFDRLMARGLIAPTKA
jgi:hypothetical protein